MEHQDKLIAILSYGIVFTVLLTTCLMLFFHYSRRKIVQKELEKIGLKLSFQKEVLQATIATQEEERTRISQDLHDAISSKLNVVSLTTHMLLDDETLTQEQKNSLTHILGVTTKTLESSRKIAHDLLPPILDKFGLKVALEELFDDFSKTSKLHIAYELHIEDDVITKTNELHTFRIIQELMNNAIRHGEASYMDIKLKVTHDNFTLLCTDNGKGFSLEKVKKRVGIGLQNIKSRVAILRCELLIESEINKGSTFHIKTKKHV